MQLVAVPLDMISAPNFYSELQDNRWEVTNPNNVTLYFRLDITDSLGQRRYIPASGSALSVIFQRSHEFQYSAPTTFNRLQSQDRTVTKLATVNTSDASLFNITMTQADIQGIVSGTVKFTLLESGNENTWIHNYMLKKSLTGPGF